MKKLSLLIPFLIVACSGVKIVGIDKEDDFSISKYKTFSFYEISNSGEKQGPNYETNLKLLKESIAKQMKSKGISLSSDNPDLLVNIGIAVEEKIQTRETSFSNPADRMAYMGQRNYSWKAGEVEVGRYREGNVTVDLVEASKNKLVWQGTAQSVVPEKQKNIPAVIEEAMEKMFAKIQ